MSRIDLFMGNDDAEFVDPDCPFPYRKVSDEEIAWAKAERLREDLLYGTGSEKYPAMIKERWAGKLCEIHLKEWGGAWVEDMRHDPLLSYDYRMGRFKVDVKGTPKKYSPRLRYSVNVPDPHMREGRKSDTFVFGWFDSTIKFTFLVGWIEKDRVFRVGKFRKKGEYFDEAKQHEVKGDCWEIQIPHLYRVDAEIIACCEA